MNCYLQKAQSNKGFPSGSNGKRVFPQCRQSNKINSQKSVMFGRVVSYKTNTQKSVAFLYNKQKSIRKELKKQSHLPLYQKEYLETNLPKEIKDLYFRNYKTLMKEIKEESILLKYTNQGKLQIECNPYQLPTAFFTELEEKNLLFVWRHKRHQIVKTIL